MEIILWVLVIVVIILIFKIADLSSQINEAERIMKSSRKEIDFWRDSYNLLKLKNK